MFSYWEDVSLAFLDACPRLQVPWLISSVSPAAGPFPAKTDQGKTFYSKYMSDKSRVTNYFIHTSCCKRFFKQFTNSVFAA